MRTAPSENHPGWYVYVSEAIYFASPQFGQLTPPNNVNDEGYSWSTVYRYDGIA